MSLARSQSWLQNQSQETGRLSKTNKKTEQNCSQNAGTVMVQRSVLTLLVTTTSWGAGHTGFTVAAALHAPSWESECGAANITTRKKSHFDFIYLRHQLLIQNLEHLKCASCHSGCLGYITERTNKCLHPLRNYIQAGESGVSWDRQ